VRGAAGKIFENLMMLMVMTGEIEQLAFFVFKLSLPNPDFDRWVFVTD